MWQPSANRKRVKVKARMVENERMARAKARRVRLTLWRRMSNRRTVMTTTNVDHGDDDN